MILDFNKKKVELDRKKAIIFNTLVNYYKDLQDSNGINIPYFMDAKAKYNELIKSNKDVNYYFNKIVEEVENERNWYKTIQRCC